MKKMTIGCSLVTGTIFCGSLLKSGYEWSSDKTDVTDRAISSVAECLLITNTNLEFNYKGKKYKLAVEEVTE